MSYSDNTGNQYNSTKLRYLSDCTGDECQIVKLFSARFCRVGRLDKHDGRVSGALFTIERVAIDSGIICPTNFASFTTVRYQCYRLSGSGLLYIINKPLVDTRCLIEGETEHAKHIDHHKADLQRGRVHINGMTGVGD